MNKDKLKRMAKPKKILNTPVKAKVVDISPSDIRTRLSLLADLPPPIISLIFDTTYSIGDGMQQGLFYTTVLRNDRFTGEEILIPEYHIVEIQEIIRVYDLIRGIHIAKGEMPNEQNNNQNTVNPNVEDLNRGVDLSKTEANAEAEFASHIRLLVKETESRLKRGLSIVDHTIFDAPALARLRELEVVKLSLQKRKRIPMKGECPKCKHGEIIMEEKQTRSGDEGGTLFRACAKCDHQF